MSRLVFIPECPGRYEYGLCIQAAAKAVEQEPSFHGTTFLITGASGMVGGAFCRMLLYLNRTKSLNIQLLLPVRSSTSPDSLKGISERPEVRMIPCDLTVPLEIPEKVDYVLHAACPTASSVLRNDCAGTARFAALSTLQILDLCAHKKIRSAVYLSSMEAYGKMEGLTDETGLGPIDLASPRSCYPESKRFCENLVACYASQYGVHAVSARLAQVLGAGIKAGENRAYASFARQALRGEPIILHTDGKSVGNYAHISDVVSALCTLFLHGKSGEIYNVCSDGASLPIRDFASRIALLLSKGKSKVAFDLPSDSTSLPYAPHTGLMLDNRKLKSLGWKNRFSLDDMILSLGEDLKEMEAL